MKRIKLQEQGQLVSNTKMQQAVSFIEEFGLPVEYKSDSKTNEIVRITKITKRGTITNKFISGNEDDQVRIYYALISRAVKFDQENWVAKFTSYRELAKTAFGNVDKNSIERAEKALDDLFERSISFKGTFMYRDMEQDLAYIQGKIRFRLVMKIIDHKKSVIIHLDNTLMNFHYDGVKEQINYKILNSFKKDQFTRKLYLWLTAKFWGRAKIYPRKTKTFLEEFGLAETNSVYKQPKNLNRKLNESMKKIWKALVENDEQFVYWFDYKNGKISFYKKVYKPKGKKK